MAKGHPSLFEHLQGSVPSWPEGMEGLGPLYQAVAHSCQARLEQKAYKEVYQNRILRGRGIDGYYSFKQLGALARK